MSLHVFIVFLQVAGRSLLYGFTRVLRPGSWHLAPLGPPAARARGAKMPRALDCLEIKY